MSNEEEIWAYDEPHESGGNAHITMTKKQAISWMMKTYKWVYIGKEEEAFQEWVAVHWAYKENQSEKENNINAER